MISPLPFAFAVACLGCGVALAGFQDSAPQGLSLAGSWRLDAANSDDPNAVLQKARASIEKRRGSHTDGDSDGGIGRGGGMGSGGRSGRGGGMGGGHGRRGGGDGQGSGDGQRGANGEGTDPQDAAATGREANRSADGALADLATLAPALAIAQSEDKLKIASGESSLECEAGPKYTIGDSAGDGERQCGWKGRAWIVETRRLRGGKRVDSYELSRDGKTLTYTTVMTGGQLPKIKIKRVYVPAM